MVRALRRRWTGAVVRNRNLAVYIFASGKLNTNTSFISWDCRNDGGVASTPFFLSHIVYMRGYNRACSILLYTNVYMSIFTNPFWSLRSHSLCMIFCSRDQSFSSIISIEPRDIVAKCMMYVWLLPQQCHIYFIFRYNSCIANEQQFIVQQLLLCTLVGNKN